MALSFPFEICSVEGFQLGKIGKRNDDDKFDCGRKGS